MATRSKEPATAPQAEQWYPVVLGSSLKDPSKRFYSLRYEFKPASIDTSRPGSLHKGAENKVTVELPNNQPSKPKVAFQGISEECKDSDAIFLFDGRTFRLERLHRAVKTLRLQRQPDESASAALPSSTDNNNNNRSPLPLNGSGSNGEDNSAANAYRAPRDHVEEIVIGSQPEPTKKNDKKKSEKKKNNNGKGKSKASPAPSPSPAAERKRSSPLEDHPSKRPRSADTTNDAVEQIDINIEDDEIGRAGGGVADHESDYELEDVDVSEDEEDGQVKGGADDQHLEHQFESGFGGNEVMNTGSSKPQSSSDSGSSSSSEEDSGSASSDDDGSDSASLGEV